MDNPVQAKSTALSPAELWPAIKDRIRGSLGEQSFRTWFGPVEFASFEDNILSLSVPDEFYADWLREYYEELIRTSADLLGVKPVLHFIVKQTPRLITTPSSMGQRNEPSPAPPSQRYGLNGNFTFDRFVVGPSNRFAHAASAAVSEAPAKAYNPLFIYGPVGLGKTHLMQAIAHKMIEDHREVKVLYISSERFTNLLITSIQNRGMERFRERFREVDILLVDDIHFIAGKETTMEEFFHTFNTLYDAHKQIVVSSDRPPKEISGLEERLISRFAWGLVTDIQPPDLETRIAIVRSKLARTKTFMPQEVVDFIAQHIKSNIRELEGALVRISAYSSLTNTSIGLNMAKEVLKDTVREESGRISIDGIQKEVADFFHLKVADLRAKRRTKNIVHPRQVAMFLARDLTNYSLLEIGQYFGGRDHSTVLYACSKVERLSGKDSGFFETLAFLKRKILG
ncbi:MAG: chromosomal replication initiator protein DnaA [Candidatus Omnitrophica bacterium]|nr:chromosomal replication initiator protein DnaA [Candidatus Omnitrophota bacterium]